MGYSKKRKIIETALPLKALSVSAMGDKAHKGHPGNMHLWWNRSPVDSSAALLAADILDDPADEEDEKRKQISAELCQIAGGKGNLSAVQNLEKPPVVCDPFSGFGGLTIAAQKVGLQVQAGDLNAVACLLTKAAAEIPARFLNEKAVHPDAENKFYFGAEGLAADVAHYGKWLRDAVEYKMKDEYPPVQIPGTKEEAPAYAWIWVRTMKCPNPACGCRMPLAGSYVLSKTAGHEYWAEPEILDKKIRFQIHQGICPKEKETNKHGSAGAKFQCPVCGEITKDEFVKKTGKEGGLEIQLMAVCVQTKDGRMYVEPDQRQMDAAKTLLPDELPIGSLPNNTRWFSPPGFGLTEYTDLYTPRQLLLMTTLCDLLPEVMSQVSEDAIAAGMTEDKVPLSEGGTGAYAYGQAVGVYLALVIGKLANFQSSICTWDNRKGNIRAAFTRQAIPMAWVFGEGNPFSTVTGNFNTMLQNVVESVAGLSAAVPAKVEQANAVTMEFPKDSVLFTELPYYDNVGYADLSDYFYIWLRRCLKNVYPQLFEKVVTSKEELSSIPEHFDGDSAEAVREYQNGIRRMLQNFHQAAAEEYPSVLFFEYSKQDEEAIRSDGKMEKMTPFEQLLDSMIQAGFMVTGVWPVRTEKANPRFDSVRIAVVFRKKKEDAQGATRRGFINTMKRELPGMLDISFSEDIEDEDKPIAGLGSGLSIFTGYKKVINADGSDMSIHDALCLIHQEIRDYLDVHAADAQTEEV
ncbi:MAG: DUF1156 domain-containing protein [Lachnospiraceae bacterium]|nr:DUF1156 domain-containing protein [Lachnospiraceae bacterium]